MSATDRQPRMRLTAEGWFYYVVLPIIAFIAGLVGGIGKGFAANSNAFLQGTNVQVNGKRQQLGIGDIAQGGVGNGVGEAGDMVSKYLIERAEQYQPVIEMPTGVDVEIVFLEGVYVRN